MKNVLLSLSIAFMLLNGGAASAQQILTQNGKDTAIGGYASGDLEVDNRIKSATGTITLRWNVTSAIFGTGWNMNGSGICDNVTCYTHDATHNIFTSGTNYNSNAYDSIRFTGSDHDFHVVFSTSNPPNGSSAVVRVNARDITGGTSRTLTFIGYKGSLGVTNISSSDDVVLYPNPVREAVNVLYDEKAGVRTIAIYNMIGKLMGPIYKPSANGSAKIDTDDMPTGIYFLRLMDAQGHVVATRRFTRL